MLPVDVSPQADAGSAGVRESEIHPSIFVEIEGDDADSRRQIFFFKIDGGKRRKFSFPRIEIDGRPFRASRKNEIDSAIIVEICGDQTCSGSVEAETAFGGYVCESAIAVVAPQEIVRRRFTGSSRSRLHGDVEIQIAVVVVVDEGETDTAGFAPYADLFCNVGEFSVAGIVEEADPISETDGEIGVAVVIKITGGAAEACCCALEARGFRDIGELAIAEIVEEMTCCDFSAANDYVGFVGPGVMEDNAGCAGFAADEEEIGFAVAVVVKKTSTVTWADWSQGSRHSARGADRLSDEG